MSRRTGIILAYDRSTFLDEDELLLDSLAPYVDLVKVGLEAVYATDDNGLNIASLVSAYAGDDMAKGSMWDGKFHDIGATVEKAIKNVTEGRPSIKMLTIHATMSDTALRISAKACADANVMPLAVTVLTDIDEEQCYLRFGDNSGDVVAKLAINASKMGIRGLVCSPKELKHLSRFPPLVDMIKVVPGIRPAWADANDQKRVMTPGEAAKLGADYIVVGRPILQPPSGITSVEASKRIREELDQAFATV